MSYISRLNAVFGAHDANSYATVQEATDYLGERYGGGAWLTMEGDRLYDDALRQREQLLITASRMVDTLTYRYGPFFSWERGFPQQQALKFPWAAHPYLFAQAASGTDQTLIAGELAGTEVYSNDFFAGGSVHIRRGANQHESRTISGFDAQMGTVTVAPAFSEPVDSTTEFYLTWPPDSALKDAAIEQAYHLLLANPGAHADEIDGRAELASSGVRAYSIGGVSEKLAGVTAQPTGGVLSLCNTSRLLLRPYLARSTMIGRA